LAQQLDGQDLAIVLVTFDENDAAKLSLADGGRRCRSGVPLVRRQHAWRSVQALGRGVSTPEARIKLAHHPRSLYVPPLMLIERYPYRPRIKSISQPTRVVVAKFQGRRCDRHHVSLHF
jgi:hypothetical protein